MPSINPAATVKLPALGLMNQVLNELGLPSVGSINSSDTTAVQVLALMNGLGEDLARMPLWSDLFQTFTIITTTATAYDLPIDWGLPLNGTSWDRTGRWPLLGPKTPTEWEYLKSGFGVAAPQYRFRYFNRQYNLFPDPIAGLEIVTEYLSLYWVLGLNGSVNNVGKARFTADTDFSLLDDRMLIQGTKLSFLEEKGLPSDIQKNKFEGMLEAAWANQNGGAVLPLAPMPQNIFITEWNAPDTGYGT